MTTATGPSATSDVLLRDGRIAQLRPVQPSDEQALLDLNSRVSLRTRRLRFFTSGEQAGIWYIENVMHNPRGGAALVALVGGELVAVASYSRLERDPSVADLGMLVDDEHQHAGLGALLLEHLAAYGRLYGITTLQADVLLDNGPMLRLLNDSGFATTSSYHDGIAEVSIDLRPRQALDDAVTSREFAAERASLTPLLAPRSVVVVGSDRKGSIADLVYESLENAGYAGRLEHLTRHTSLSTLVAPIDLVVVAVPAEHVLGVAKDAAAHHVKALAVLSARFSEAGADGERRQAELLAVCRQAGMRLVGPNCLGVVNTDPDVRLNATFCDAQPRPGGIALISQSGAVGVAALRHAERRGAGLSVFVSTGNKADISGNDLLAYVAEDPRTTAVALYLESFGNATKFARIAAAVSRRKPVVVVKSGRTLRGASAIRAHTASTATSDEAVDALLHRAGAIRVDDLPSLFDVLQLLDGPALPRGGRVVVVGNSGGPGVMAADACESAGLTLAELSEQTREQIAAVASPGAVLDNPVDLLATVTPDVLEQAVRVVLSDPGVDAVVAIYTAARRGGELEYAAALARAQAGHPDAPVIAVLPGVAQAPTILPRSITCFEFPEPALKALGLVVAHVQSRRDHEPTPALPETPQRTLLAARSLLDPYVPDPAGTWLPPAVTVALLEQYGVACQPGREEERAPLRVGIVRDAMVGALVVAGAAGSDTDRVVRMPPRSRAEALEQLHDVAATAGLAESALLALADLLLALSRLAQELPEVHELDLDRVHVSDDLAVAVEARIRVLPADPTAGLPQRDLNQVR